MGGGGGGGGEGIRILGWGQLFAGYKLIEERTAPTPPTTQCQIITFLILKNDNIAKLRKELKSILLAISNKIKGTYSKLVHL